jgi:transposase-like protein
MRCKRCKTPMRESPAVHHKKRKWVCPKCGRARMQRTGKSKGGRKERSGGWED